MDVARERRALLAALRAREGARGLARAWVRAHPGERAARIHRLLEDLWPRGDDARLLVCELLRARPQLAVLLPRATMDRWRRDLATCAVADAFGVAALGAWTAADPARLAHLQRLAASHDPLSRRATLAAVPRLVHEADAAVLAIVDRFLEDPDPRVRRAVPRTLRALAKTSPDAVRAYARRRARALPDALVRALAPRTARR